MYEKFMNMFFFVLFVIHFSVHRDSSFVFSCFEAELCARMLAFEATERPSAEEALKHVPWKHLSLKSFLQIKL